MKRYAAHYIYHPDQGFLKQHLVEVEEGQVVALRPLVEEIENVAWHPGVIVLTWEDNQWVPYLYYPFDFKAMQPVDGTQRKLLR